MAKGYWVAFVNVKKKEEYQKYVDLAGPAINLHGGKFLVRGGNVENFEGKNYERIVKLGDPAKKISELASSLNVDTIVMGRRGLSDTDSDLGHVTSKLLSLSSKPIVLV